MSKVKYIKTLWGINMDFSDLSQVKNHLINFKRKGFDGVEIATGFFDHKYQDSFMKLLKEVDLKTIVQIHTCSYPITKRCIEDHIDDYKNKVEQSLTWNPDCINSHSGRDDWSDEENTTFFKRIAEYEKTLSYSNLFHELHRQRVLYNPRNFLLIAENVPSIQYTADISHWVLSCSRLFNNETDKDWDKILKYLGERSGIIHSRIGTTDQIQTINPMSKDNKEFKEYFENIWKTIYKTTKRKELYVDIEYGPFPYCIVDPLDNKPIIDTEDVIDQELDNLKKNVFI